MRRGKFIVFEGIDGCGKGTQLKLSSSYLLDFSKDIILFLTREPTKDFSQIRKEMASGKAVEDKRRWYAEQFTQDRRNHCEKYIVPNLEKGVHVLSDRYYYSTLAYQQSQGLSFEELLAMQKQYPEILIPDLVLIYDCPADIAFERRKEGGATDIFERDLNFQKKLRENYLKLRETLPAENIFIINSRNPVEVVFNETKGILKSIFTNWVLSNPKS